MTSSWMHCAAKRLHLCLGLLLLAVFSGCDTGSSEKFIAPGDKGFGLASHNGSLLIVPGSPLLDNGRTMGPQENLLYLLVVCPGLAANASGNLTDFGQRSNTYIWQWETSKGQVSVRASWDKRKDEVSIGKQQFDRNAGSTFVIIRQSDGKLMVTQLPSPGPDADAKIALSFIQKHMTNDAEIASVRLAERD